MNDMSPDDRLEALRPPRSKRLAEVVVAGLGRLKRKSARASGSTSLRRLPIVVAISVGAVSAPIFWTLTNRLSNEREESTWQRIQAEAADRTQRAMVSLAGGASVEDGLLFVVNPDQHSSRSMAPTDVEPPLFQFAAEAANGPAESWFEQRGRSLVAFTRRADAAQFVVAVQDVSWLNSENAHQRSDARRWSFAGWVTLVGLAGALTHLLLRPARRVFRERIDFLADAAHELRTPLSVIQASAGHALARERDTAEYVQSLAEIRAAAERAGAGVSELLDLARFDAGQAVPRVAPLRLDLLAEEIAAATRLDDCIISARTSPTVLVLADMALLRQALDNLVRNAAARAGTVVLSCRTEGSDGVVEVSDDGPGFSAEQLPYVFERYRRGDGKGSLGLGLPIAASIVAAHGGRIDIESPVEQSDSDPHPDPALSPGARITVRLPLARA